jgi:biotin carboxylase
VESVCAPDGSTHVAITGKFPLEPPFREQGGFWPAPLPIEDETAILALVDRSLAALDIPVGITHTEVKLTPAGPRVIEVNGRLGGHIHDLAQRSAHLDLVRANALAALGRPVPLSAAEPDRVCFQNFCLARPHRAG